MLPACQLGGDRADLEMADQPAPFATAAVALPDGRVVATGGARGKSATVTGEVLFLSP